MKLMLTVKADLVIEVSEALGADTISYKTEGSKYGACGVRIDGNPQFMPPGGLGRTPLEEGVEHMERDAAIHVGYVLDTTDNVYVQIPADNARGFLVCDDDQSWEVPPFASWLAVDDDDPRVSDEDRNRLGWILDEARAAL